MCHTCLRSIMQGCWGELASGRWREAEAEYLAALAVRETGDAHFNLANLYAEYGVSARSMPSKETGKGDGRITSE